MCYFLNRDKYKAIGIKQSKSYAPAVDKIIAALRKFYPTLFRGRNKQSLIFYLILV